MYDTVSLQVLSVVIAAIVGFLTIKLAVSGGEINFGKRTLLVVCGLVMLFLAAGWIYITVRMTNVITSTFLSAYLPVFLIVLVLIIALIAFIALKRRKSSKE